MGIHRSVQFLSPLSFLLSPQFDGFQYRPAEPGKGGGRETGAALLPYDRSGRLYLAI